MSQLLRWAGWVLVCLAATAAMGGPVAFKTPIAMFLVGMACWFTSVVLSELEEI